MKASDADRDPLGAKPPGDVERTRILVRLHADDADQRPTAALLQVADDGGRKDAPVGLVVGFDREIDAGSEHFAVARVLGEAVHASKSVGGQRGAIPLNGIAPVVVVSRLDQNKDEAGITLGRTRCCCFRFGDHQDPQPRIKEQLTGNIVTRGGQIVEATDRPIKFKSHNGGTRPSLPTRMRTASIVPSFSRGPRATTAAPALRSAGAPGANDTIGVLGSTAITCWPPL